MLKPSRPWSKTAQYKRTYRSIEQLWLCMEICVHTQASIITGATAVLRGQVRASPGKKCWNNIKSNKLEHLNEQKCENKINTMFLKFAVEKETEWGISNWAGYVTVWIESYCSNHLKFTFTVLSIYFIIPMIIHLLTGTRKGHGNLAAVCARYNRNTDGLLFHI